MKKLVVLFSLVSIFALQHANSQNVAVGIHTGFSAFVGNTSIGVPIGVNVEWAYDSKHSFAGRGHYNIKAGTGSAGLFYISSEYKYHITGETLDGFYVGAYIGFGGGSGSGYLSAGAVTGYSLEIGDHLNFESNVQAGYGLFTNRDIHVFHLVPTIGFRYTF